MNMINTPIDLDKIKTKKYPYWNTFFQRHKGMIFLYPVIHPFWDKLFHERMAGIRVIFLFWEVGIRYKWVQKQNLVPGNFFENPLTIECVCGYIRSFDKKGLQKIHEKEKDLYCPNCGNVLIHFSEDSIKYNATIQS